MPLRHFLLAAAVSVGVAASVVAMRPGAPLHPASFAAHAAQCAGKDGWSDPAPPVRIFGNVYDVGTCGITVVLVVGDRGAMLIDGAAANAAPMIALNIERLGLRLSDVKLLLSSHEHADHAGGLNELKRRTGGQMVATTAARRSLESGVMAANDPQRDGDRPAFPGVRVDRVVRDGEVVRLGSLRLTAHATPGHAPGGTSWSWRSCEGRVCHDLVFADSLSAVSTDGYRFSDHGERVAALKASFATVARLRCDLVVTPHPSASDLYARLAGEEPLVDPRGCINLAAASAAKLDDRLQKERTDRQKL
ncbi:subclass B3 metallo-beta-lactamase [Sphingomonas rubra]|uniref:beta-lactamase n=1 Tax=Sphingomonas rubra TaxID=634430 RepID=A0A1I5QFV5_9SPHN|nr:subclass B3 metallo-beta-lactamase [Sphingomonas rubra]SFP45179.1 metallo-beta-lactamase class B [Sphingomonas rubra]